MNRTLCGICATVVALGLLGCKSTERPRAQTSDHPRAITNSTDVALETELQTLIDRGEAVNAELERISETNANESLSSDDIERLSEAARAKQDAASRGFQTFIRRHPRYGGGYAGYGDFLLGHYDELGARTQLEKALDFDRTNATVYNDLANIYGHRGDVKEAFNYYAKAIELNSNETVYYQNFATTVFLFRKDAREYYNINEQQVFDKAMLLYSNAMRLDPTNFALAADVAKSYYGIKPWRFDDAMRAWTNALNLASGDVERQEVYTHFARVQTQAGNYQRARQFLDQVSDPKFSALKNRMLKNIEVKQKTGA